MYRIRTNKELVLFFLIIFYYYYYYYYLLLLLFIYDRMCIIQEYRYIVECDVNDFEF